jgi:hypothetical protein
MPKLAAPATLCLFVLFAAGCQMNRPPEQAPDAAWNTYKGRLAEQCSAKHLENMPAEKLNEIANDFYIDADTQIQQLIDADRQHTCGKNGPTVDCLNTGFIQASVQAGSLNDFVKQVCRKA